jgi:hypothetical protein
MNAKSPPRVRNIRRVARPLRAEVGFALPTTMLMLLTAFAVVSVGVASTVSVQRGTVRDQSTKSAFQLAETGVNEALLHLNRIKPSPTNACSPVSGSGPGGSGWCSPVTATDPAGGTYTYEVRVCDALGSCPPAAGKLGYSLEIVGTGTAGAATRRVYVQSHSAQGQAMFSDYQVKAADGITLDSNARIHAGTATNGDITLSSNAKQCGQASVGIGRQLKLISNAGYFSDPSCTQPYSTVNQEQLTLPPVNQGDVATNNDNGRFFTQDVISGNKSKACWNGKNGNGQNDNSCGARHLDIQSNTSVTLGGSKYSFCKLTMSSNTSLLVASGHTVSIYFDSPEACGYSSGVVQLDMASNTRITTNDGQPAQVQLLFVGSTTRQTKILLSSNTDINASCVQNFVVYAPLTDIEMNSNSTYCGALAGKTLHLDSNADIRTDALSQGYIIPATSAHYTLDRFIECTATTASPPNTGC